MLKEDRLKDIFTVHEFDPASCQTSLVIHKAIHIGVNYWSHSWLAKDEILSNNSTVIQIPNPEF